jgi:7-keto-8-aminopelargonate synthetase-like enzyme
VRAWLVGLAGLGVALAVAVIVFAYQAARAQFQGQAIGSSGALTTELATREQHLFLLSYAFSTIIPPLAMGALLCLVAILAVLARRTQLRRAAVRRTLRTPAPAR